MCRWRRWKCAIVSAPIYPRSPEDTDKKRLINLNYREERVSPMGGRGSFVMKLSRDCGELRVEVTRCFCAFLNPRPIEFFIYTLVILLCRAGNDTMNEILASSAQRFAEFARRIHVMKRVSPSHDEFYIKVYFFTLHGARSIRRRAKFRRERQFCGETSSCRSTMRRKVGIEDEAVLSRL